MTEMHAHGVSLEARETVKEAASLWWLFLLTGIAWIIVAWLILRWDYSTVTSISTRRPSFMPLRIIARCLRGTASMFLSDSGSIDLRNVTYRSLHGQVGCRRSRLRISR